MSQAPSPQFKRFIASNGHGVVKVVTPSGVTGYVPTSVPQAALEGLAQKLRARIAARAAGIDLCGNGEN